MLRNSCFSRSEYDDALLCDSCESPEICLGSPAFHHEMNVIGHEAVREYCEPLRDRGLLNPRARSSDERGIREYR